MKYQEPMEQARECLRRARRATQDSERALYLAMADVWAQLARTTEKVAAHLPSIPTDIPDDTVH
jgi:hypothetical protein